MKNLKRALSFTLATVMLIGMMVVGASAASFGDADEIVNADAVNTMVALNIIKGKDDGNFDPTGIVTRAEMAKMICVALNGGKDPNLAGGGLYPDTKGHWASGYIDYCTNLGIVAGDTAGNFNPDKTVTGTEAAKMILIALGYNAQNEKFVNDANWSLNINILASTKELYEDLAVLPAEGLTRDNAAQMIWNGLNATMVKYDYVLNTVDGNLVSVPVAEDITIGVLATPKTILNAKYGTYATAPEGVISKITYNSKTEKWTYTVTGAGTFTTDKDFTDLMGMNVKVIAKQSDDTVYGIFAEDSKVVVEGFVGDFTVPAATATTITVDGEDYDLEGAANTIKVINNMTGVEASKLSAISGTYSFKAIDNDDDNKIDQLVVVPFTVEKITYVGKDTITLDGIGNKKYEDVSLYEGYAKNDRVTVVARAYAPYDIITVEEAEVVTGTITGLKGGKFKIDGTWMTNNTTTTLDVNDTIKYIAFGSVIYYAEVTDGDSYSEDLALVITAGSEGGASGLASATQKAKLIFADGTKETVTVSADATDKVGKLVTYYVNNDKEYVLTPVSNTNKAGYTVYNATAPAGTGTTIDTVGTYDLADDAIVFVFGWKGTNATTADADNTAKVVTGKEATDLLKANFTSGCALGKTTSGFTYAKVALLVAANSTVNISNSFTGNSYGYLTSDGYNTRVDGTTYVNFTMWDGSKELDVKVKETTGLTPTELKAGTVITHDVDSADVLKNVSITSLTTGAVTGWDGTEKVKFDGVATTYKVTKDTVVLYVASKDKEGVEGGEIAIADKPTTTYVNNVKYTANDKNELKLLIVDVNNKMQ